MHDFRLPTHMLNLTSVNIAYAGGVYSIDNIFKLGLFPKLQHLSIDLPENKFWNRDIFTDVKYPRVEVTSMRLDCHLYQCQRELERIVAACPSVTKLNFKLVVDYLDPEGLIGLEILLETLNGWMLEKGVVSLKEAAPRYVPPILEFWATLNSNELL